VSKANQKYRAWIDLTIWFFNTLLLSFCFFLILTTFFLPFIVNKYSESELRIVLFVMGISFVVILFWIKFHRKKALNKNRESEEIENVANAIFESSIGHEEAGIINNSAGWRNRGVSVEKFNSKQLKSAFELAGKKQKEKEALKRRWIIFFMVLAFLMAPFGFSGLLEWGTSGGVIKPITSGSFCLIVGFFLFYSYIQQR